jgi:thiol-disulfide isomerase/thioredoxin
MKFSSLTILMLLSLAACSSTNKSGVTLKGQIKDEASGTKIYLEELTYSKRNVLDSSTLDAKGGFSLTAALNTSGLYQLRTAGNHAIYLVLDEKPVTITINADTSSIRKFSYRITGSPSSEQMRQFVVQMKKLGEAYGLALGEYGKNVTETTPDSIRAVYATKMNLADSNFRTYARGYIDTVKNPVIAIFAVVNLDFNRDRVTFDKLEARVRKDYPDLPFVQGFLAMIESQKKPSQQNVYAPKFAVGDVPPDIQLQNPLGVELKLSSLRGQYVLLDFWASWCGPCRRENPAVVAVYEKYKDQGFTVFSVSLDTDHDKWVNAIKQDHLDWTMHVSELKGWKSAICGEFGIQSIPQNFLLDKDGKIIAVGLRGADLGQKLSEVLQ